ncbi:D-alanyl-D-alanine carboxypeptidase DacC precursor [Candidatus Brocadiaceae bacterium B188]|nr:MAG: D-alanyl-D-alanine carboxypeptidase/D-alanyl-D-alanine-endopeptidase [Candidatus Brocadia sp. BROELEC01]TWU50118.1 D-alanyl-D-alanine carboxypeptidase DacC precursor [Candidatus Brocadiaceae bacterium B188]
MRCCRPKLKTCLNTFAFLLVFCMFFADLLDAKITDANDLKNRLLPFFKNPSLKNVSYGVSVVSVNKNSSLFNYRNDDLFSVASNMKLLTTSAALEYLGPDFEYKTSIDARGIITAAGELRGDIVIKGSGDPNISGRFYDGNVFAIPESWAQAVKSKGIQVITGDIIADDSIFDRTYTNPNWPENQLSQWYCAPSCGLSFNDNCVDITLAPGKKPGDVVKLFVEPRTSYYTICNTCVYTQNKKEHLYSIQKKPGTNEILIKGKFWVNSTPEKTWVSIYNPALYLATVFKEMLEKNGIVVYGTVRLINEGDFADSDVTNIVQTASTMEQTILVTNKQSQNFYAEQIIKTLGAQIKGSGTLKAGIEVVQDFMSKIGFQPGEYYIDDGCGLSKENRLSPKMITTLLAYMSKHQYGRVLWDSLPTSGIDGGLRRRMGMPKYKSKIHAKTGYIARTSALSGYVDAANGEILAFSILMNNFKDLKVVQKIQDDICQALVDCY